MRKYIDVEKAIKAIDELPNCYNGYSDTYDKAYIIGALEEVPTADVVERKVGEWKDGYRSSWDGTLHWYRYCDQCGYERDDDDPIHDSYYCPNCGAEMEKGEE